MGLPVLTNLDGLTATPRSDGLTVDLSWAAVAGATDYELQVRVNPDGLWWTIASGLGAVTSYTDECAAPGRALDYRLRSVTLAGTGAYGNPVSIVMPAFTPRAVKVFCSPNGVSTGLGATPATAVSLLRAKQIADLAPGTVVGLLDGEYPIQLAMYLNVGGTPTARTQWRAVNQFSPVINCNGWASPGESLFGVNWGGAYTDFWGIVFKNTARDCPNPVLLRGTHHTRMVGNFVQGFRSGGFAQSYNNGEGGITRFTDYSWWLDNIFWLGGGGGAGADGSAISCWRPTNQFDNKPGPHFFIIGNTCAGWQDAAHTDGNGIIVDNPTVFMNALYQTHPWVVIANNICYFNGARGIHTLNATHVAVVHNTTDMNALDYAVAGGTKGNNGEYVFSAGQNALPGLNSQVFAINNIGSASDNGRYWSHESHFGAGWIADPAAAAFYRGNTWQHVTAVNPPGVVATAISSIPTRLRRLDPGFVNPPVVPTSGNRWLSAPDPRTLGRALALAATSMARGASLGLTDHLGPLIPEPVKAAIEVWARYDHAGVKRPATGANLGALEDAPPDGGGT